MRRLLALTPAALLLAGALGCCHTAGICDCGQDLMVNPCCVPHAMGYPVQTEPIQAPPAKAEAIKSLPKTEGK